MVRKSGCGCRCVVGLFPSEEKVRGESRANGAKACSPQHGPLAPRQPSTPNPSSPKAMSANEIPNLKTLLGTRRGGLPRGRGRGRGFPGASHEGSEVIKDNAVRCTDQDAAGSRVSCVELGYLHDPYAKLFATQPSTRRLPLLNRGKF